MSFPNNNLDRFFQHYAGQNYPWLLVTSGSPLFMLHMGLRYRSLLKSFQYFHLDNFTTAVASDLIRKARKNPVEFTEESVDKGKSLYLTQCEMCHGKSGDGKGDLAAVMHLNLPDMTQPDTLAKFSDGEIYAMISSGSGPMPSEANRLKPETIWDLVNFLRSVEGKKPQKPAGKKPK